MNHGRCGRNHSLTSTAVGVLFALGMFGPTPAASAQSAAANVATPAIAVGPQYDSTHVYVAPQDLGRFAASFLGTFGGHSSKPVAVTVTPTPSRALWQFLQTPVGALSVFGFTSPIPFPFGSERTGYLVTDMDAAVLAARKTGAHVLVAPFPDPIGRDAIIQWPGGVNSQLYWHTKPPSSPPLQTIPENRVYVSPDAAEEFVHSFLAFAHGTVISDDADAPGVEIGRPRDTYRRIRIKSNFGKLVVFVTDGHLPYPYGRETTGYEVTSVTETLAKAKTLGVIVLVAPYSADGRIAAIAEFPGGYIAEIHSVASK